MVLLNTIALFVTTTVIIFIRLSTEADNDYESVWMNGMGNPCNTRRIIPSMPTNFSGQSWHVIYNSSTLNMPIKGMGVGVSGDLYIFSSENPSYPADYLLCLTTNGLVRWKLYLEPIGNMINMGTSNFVSNRRGDVFITTSWANHSAYSAKVCHLTNVETSQPVQRCVENYQLYANFHTPLAINDASVYLFTTVFDQAIQQVPAVIGIDTLGIVRIDRRVVGAAPDSEYNDDGTGIYWIGDDNHFIKVNGADTRLLNVNMPSGGNRYYAFDRYHAKIVKAWQNGSEITAPLVVSGWDALASGDFRLLWQWAQPLGDFTRCTQPVINDQTGITYIASLPYLFAINMNGIIFWQAEIVSQSEIKTFNLVSTCLALNTETKIIYIVIASTSAVQSKQSSTLFIATAHMDTGAVLKRININVPSNTTITPNCPMLIGNDMLYISWLEGNFSNLVPLNIMGLPQLNSNETPK